MQNQQIIEAVNKVATSLKTSEILKELGNATWDKDKLTNLLHESKAAYDQATSNEDFKNILNCSTPLQLLHARLCDVVVKFFLKCPRTAIIMADRFICQTR